MILSDKQIETGDWTYTSFQISHLEANAELRKAGERIRELEAKLRELVKKIDKISNDYIPPITTRWLLSHLMK